MSNSSKAKSGDTAKAALKLLTDRSHAFPGLIDLETDVNGAALVNWLTELIHNRPIIKRHMQLRIIDNE